MAGKVLDPTTIATSLMFNLPIAMRFALEEKAADADVTVAKFVRDIVAEAIGYKLPVGEGRARKYATEQEKKDAQKAKNQEHRNKVNAIMEAYRKGTLNLESLEALQPSEDEDD